jgi:VWFA-related protein
MRFSVSLLMAVVVATVLAAQAPSGPQQPTFRTAVNFVRVDVYPTSAGRPVADLARADFEVLEDGVLQAVDTFEHIVVRPRDIVAERVEPRSLREANEMAADARNRLFVLFLDTYHVTDQTSPHDGTLRFAGPTTTRRPAEAKPLGPARIDRALVNFLNRAIGPTDMFAAFTPEMDVEQLSFTRRPENFEDLVRTVWGRRFSWDDLDPEEERWGICYPADETGFGCYPGVLESMVLRRREGLTLEAVRRLVQRLGELREERKAVLLVSEGWAMFRPDTTLARPLPRIPSEGCPVVYPEGKGIYVGPDGKPKAGTDPRTYMTVDWQQCEAARATLAHVDDTRTYRELLDEANRTNTSFYPVDLRGLAVFDTPIDAVPPGNLGAKPPLPGVGADFARLRERLETLRNLASATDGKMTETNDLAGGLKKIADDLSDYYLLGYYSTNAKTDGTFRKITVRVKRPGVAVRARRGYLAPTEAEVAGRKAAAVALDPEVATRESALASLGAIRADRPFHMAAGLEWHATAAGAQPRPAIWITGEMDIAAARDMAWSAGAEASITVTSAGGQAMASEQAKVSSVARAFLLHLTPDLPAGEYLVRAKLQGRPGGGADASQQVRVIVPDANGNLATALGQALLFRRGSFSGAGFQPTADLRFRKAERIRVDVPLAGPVDAVGARLLDRRGQPLPIPVATSQRDEGGVRLATAEVALAPLALGDYLIEVSARRGERQDKVLAAVRIVP